MPPKRLREEIHLPVHTSISDLWTSHNFLSTNEYSRDTIGIQSFLTRQFDNEHFGKLFYQLGKIDPRLIDYYNRLESVEKKIPKEKSNSDLERCAIINRLRYFLKQNEDFFQNIINLNETHLQQCMIENRFFVPIVSEIQFIQECIQRIDAVFKRNKAQRMRRFHFYDHIDADKPENFINLQNWIKTHFERFIETITPQSSPQLITHFNLLLSDSFSINQHPSPAIATYTLSNNGVTANIHCRLLCLLDLSNKAITIDKIVPIVRCLTTLNQPEESNIYYEQRPLDLNTCSIVTGSNTNKKFFYAELSKIVLEQTSTSIQNQKQLTGKIHYAQHVYWIDFCIYITVNFPNNPVPYQLCVIVRSAPFGLISNTAQLSNLFANVYLEDLKSWKQTSLSFTMPISVNIINPLAMTNLTIEEIVNNLTRYFIHKTGIESKKWMKPYIEGEFNIQCKKQKGPIDVVCHDLLAKILAQIDYMAEHSLLILFYEDGFFHGICNSTIIQTILREWKRHSHKSICAIRFGSMNNMIDAKNVSVRIDLFDNTCSNIQYFTFDTNKLSFDLVLFIVKIVLHEASRFEYILKNFTMNDKQADFFDIFQYVQLYYSNNLRDIVPQKEKYNSIWNITEKKKEDVSIVSPSNLLQNLALSPNPGTTTEMELTNSTYSSSSNINTNTGTQPYQPYYNPIQPQLQITQQLPQQAQIPNQNFQYQVPQNPQYQMTQNQYPYQPPPSQFIHQQYQLPQFQQQQQFLSPQFQQQQLPSQQQLYQSFPQASPPSYCFHCGQSYSNVSRIIVVVNQNSSPAVPQDILLQQINHALTQHISSAIQIDKIICLATNNNNSQSSNSIPSIVSQTINTPNLMNNTDNE